MHSLRIHINEERIHVNGQQILRLSFSYNHHIIWNSLLYFCPWLYQQEQHNIYHPNKGKPKAKFEMKVVCHHVLHSIILNALNFIKWEVLVALQLYLLPKYLLNTQERPKSSAWYIGLDTPT